jgi:hypothetical protein
MQRRYQVRLVHGAPERAFGWVIDTRTGNQYGYSSSFTGGTAIGTFLQTLADQLNAQEAQRLATRRARTGRRWRIAAFCTLSLALLALLSACGSPLPRGHQPEVVFTSADSIAFRQPGGAVHLYRFGKGRRP